MSNVQRESGGGQQWSLSIRTFSEIQAEPVEWLWPGRIPLGDITLIVGKPGRGKSFLTCDLAALLSCGRAFPDGADNNGGQTLFVAAEDDPGRVIRPRLEACGADLAMVQVVDGITRQRRQEIVSAPFTLAEVKLLDDALEARPLCRMVVIDPINSFLPGGADSHKDTEVRQALMPLMEIARRRRVAVVLVSHRRKGSMGAADEAAMGSVGFVGLARSVMHVCDDPADNRKRILAMGKNNFGPPMEGIGFHIGGEPAKVIWGDAVNMTADEALRGEVEALGESGRPPEARDEAEEWLTEQLRAGPVAVDKLRAEAKAAGVSWRTVERAKKGLRIKGQKNGFAGGWDWRFLRAGDSGGLGGDTKNSQIYGGLGGVGDSESETRVLCGNDSGGVPRPPNPLGVREGGTLGADGRGVAQ